MADFNTFIKLHRSILDSAVFSDAEVLRLWIYLLCKASVDDRQIIFDGRIVNIKKGQLITGRKKIAEHLNTTESKAYRSLKLLQELGCVNIEANNKFSLVTLLNWGKFQDVPRKSEQQNNNKITTEQQQFNNRLTTDQQQNDTKKELNNYKELNNASFTARAREKKKSFSLSNNEQAFDMGAAERLKALNKQKKGDEK